MTSTTEVLDTVLAPVPDVAATLDQSHRAAWAVVDPVVLELCRLRIAQLLNSPHDLAERTPAATEAGLDEATVAQLAGWPTAAAFTATQKACLAFTEQWVIDVATMTDDLAGAVVDHLGPEGAADFANALLCVEQRIRLRLIWENVL